MDDDNRRFFKWVVAVGVRVLRRLWSIVSVLMQCFGAALLVLVGFAALAAMILAAGVAIQTGELGHIPLDYVMDAVNTQFPPGLGWPEETIRNAVIIGGGVVVEIWNTPVLGPVAVLSVAFVAQGFLQEMGSRFYRELFPD